MAVERRKREREVSFESRLSMRTRRDVMTNEGILGSETVGRSEGSSAELSSCREEREEDVSVKDGWRSARRGRERKRRLTMSLNLISMGIQRAEEVRSSMHI